MVHPFKDYELRVLEVLLRPEYNAEQLSKLLEVASIREIKYTNYGFYVSIEHPDIGETRRVYSGPTTLHGRLGSHDAGFVAFLQHNQLTLETYPWDGENLPATFRDNDVRLTNETSRSNVPGSTNVDSGDSENGPW
jgi:hypothetical protein